MGRWLDGSAFLSSVFNTHPSTCVILLGCSKGTAKESVRGVRGVVASDTHLHFHRIEREFRTMESGPSSPQPAPSDPLEAFPQRSLEPGDIAVLVLYFLFVLAVGVWVSQASGRERGEETSSRSYSNQNFKFLKMC